MLTLPRSVAQRLRQHTALFVVVPQRTGEGMANDAAEEGCGRLDLFTLGVNAPPVLVAPEVSPRNVHADVRRHFGLGLDQLESLADLGTVTPNPPSRDVASEHRQRDFAGFYMRLH